MKARQKPYAKMTAAELRAATSMYDRELPIGPDGLPGRPMNASERKQWKSVCKKMGRPKLGKAGAA